MAYAFDRLYNAMGRPQQQEQPQQANIFGQEQGGGAGAPAGQQMPGAGPSRIRSSTEGSLEPNARAVQQQGTESAPAPGPTSSSAAVKANVGKTQAPVDLSKISGSIGEAKSKVQGEADAYLQGESIKPFTASSGSTAVTPEHAIDPRTIGLIDEWATGKPSGNEDFGVGDSADWMTQYQQGPGGAKAFDAKTNTDFRDVNDLKTDAGVQNLLRRRGDAEYSAGEAAFDAGLLRQDQGFQQGRRDVLDANQALQDQVGKLEGESQGKAQNARNANYQTWKDAVSKHLEELAGGYRTDAQRREGVFDQGLAVDPSYANATSEGILQEMRSDPKLLDQLPFLNLEGIDRGAFVNEGMGADQTNEAQFYTPEEAGRFNKIMDLLGNGGFRAQGEGIENLTRVDPSQRGAGYNAQGLRQAILANAAAAKQADDQRKANSAEVTIGAQPGQPRPSENPPGIAFPENGEPIMTVPDKNFPGRVDPTEPHKPSQEGQANVENTESGGGGPNSTYAKDVADVIGETIGGPVKGAQKVGDAGKKFIGDTGLDTEFNKAGGKIAGASKSLGVTPAATSYPKLGAAVANSAVMAAAAKQKAALPAQNAAAAAAKAAAAAPKVPVPAAQPSPVVVGGPAFGADYGAGTSGAAGVSPYPSINAAIQAAADAAAKAKAAGGQVAKTAKEKGGSAAKTLKKIAGRG